MATKTSNAGYDSDWGLEPKLSVDPALLDASVDGQGGTIKGKPVFTGDQAAFFLNRGDPIDARAGVLLRARQTAGDGIGGFHRGEFCHVDLWHCQASSWKRRTDRNTTGAPDAIFIRDQPP